MYKVSVTRKEVKIFTKDDYDKLRNCLDNERKLLSQVYSNNALIHKNIYSIDHLLTI